MHKPFEIKFTTPCWACWLAHLAGLFDDLLMIVSGTTIETNLFFITSAYLHDENCDKD